MSTDEELWRRAIEGHSLAFGEIFDRHHLRVQMLARLPEGTHETDPADDIADRLASAQSIAASARAAYRAEPALGLLTSEEAWVAGALREAGVREC
jgi:hypothetical protein